MQMRGIFVTFLLHNRYTWSRSRVFNGLCVSRRSLVRAVHLTTTTMSDMQQPHACESLQSDDLTDPGQLAQPDAKHSATTLSDDVAAQSNDTGEKKPLSKRAQKRMKRAAENNAKSEAKKAKKKRKKDIDIDISAETSCYYENGLRKVYPYIFTFTTYAKQRWLNMKLLDVFTSEFKHFPPHVFRRKVDAGEICVNGAKVGTDYILKDNDFISNTAHRHEVPVTDEPIRIIHDCEDLLVINKPSSIPCHPCGNFRHNSAIFILDSEYGYKRLRFVHRIDRLTSGLLLLAKNEAKAAQLCRQVANRELQKEYLCRVEGSFPDGVIESNEPLDLLSHKLGIQHVSPTGKEAKTTFERISYNGKSSVVWCRPHTGRTHQIRVHLQYLGYPIVNDPMYNDVAWGPKKGKGGDFGKTPEEVIACMLRDHDRMKYVMAELNPVDDSSKDKTPRRISPNNVENNISSHSESGSETINSVVDSMTSTVGHVSSVNTNNLEQSGTLDFSHKESLPVDKLSWTATDNVKAAVDAAQINSEDTNVFGEVRPDVVSAVVASRKQFDASKMTFDSSCADCIRKFKDPKPDELVMYLHALKYKGPDWEYSTPLPLWAAADWKE